ncbi:MAG: hypothetical protein ABR536_05350 [Solirubrobacterales bacterium]
MSDPDDRIFEIGQVPDAPGTYFNPKTEVLIVVDDSASVDQGAFEGPYARAPWVRVSDEVPIDESARDEALESFETEFHPGASHAPVAEEDDDAVDDEDEDELDEEDFDEEDVIDPNAADDAGEL